MSVLPRISVVLAGVSVVLPLQPVQDHDHGGNGIRRDQVGRGGTKPMKSGLYRRFQGFKLQPGRATINRAV